MWLKRFKLTEQTPGFGAAEKSCNALKISLVASWNKQRAAVKDDKKMKKEQVK